MGLHLTAAHRSEIEKHGVETYPHECCGFLVGSLNGEDSTVVETVRAINTRTDRPSNRFEIDPLELMKTDRAARANGKTVVGFYHSHPDAPARPSEYDRERAWPGYCYLIVSVRSGIAVDFLNWRLLDDRSAFETDPVRIDAN